MGDEVSFPKCLKCGKGVLVPFSDFSNNQVAIRYKAWACTNSECRSFIALRGGDVYYESADKQSNR